MSAALPRRVAVPVAVPLVAALAAAAWVALWIWERSPYGRYLDHGGIDPLQRLCGAASGWVEAGFYAGGWTLMTVAMMLPTTLPLMAAFQRLTAARPDRAGLLALLVAGYLAVWLAFGVAAHLLDHGLHLAADASRVLQQHAWLFGAGALLGAGAFQFSRLKYRCLDQCRAPVSFVVQHWRGGRPRAQAFAIGVHHGAFCVGCCWALMLLMFAVGIGSVGWMLALGAVMAVEKNAPWGRRLAAPLGVALIGWGAAIVVMQALR